MVAEQDQPSRAITTTRTRLLARGSDREAFAFTRRCGRGDVRGRERVE